MVLISLYVKRRNKAVCLFVNTKISAVALIRKQCYLIIFGKGVGMLHLFKRGRLIEEWCLAVLNGSFMVVAANKSNILRQEMRNFVSPSDHVMFYLLCKHL